jgi:glycosyltransferase involved in cell wall biosynthesis
MNANHPTYLRKFEHTIRDNERIQYLGRLSREEVRLLLRRSWRYVNASWVEVVSQADIEASAMGIPVMSTRHSYLQDFVGGGYLQLEPKDFIHSSTGARVLTETRQSRIGEPSFKLSTWSDAAARLADVYSRFGVSP